MYFFKRRGVVRRMNRGFRWGSTSVTRIQSWWWGCRHLLACSDKVLHSEHFGWLGSVVDICWVVQTKWCFENILVGWGVFLIGGVYWGSSSQSRSGWVCTERPGVASVHQWFLNQLSTQNFKSVPFRIVGVGIRLCRGERADVFQSEQFGLLRVHLTLFTYTFSRCCLFFSITHPSTLSEAAK